MDIRIVGADASYAKSIRNALNTYPGWFVRAARINHIEVSSRIDVVNSIAMYEHDTRNILVSPRIGSLLRKAIGHELAHGVDDLELEASHFFSTQSEWLTIHRNQAYFDIQKYGDEPMEYFADMLAKFFLLGKDRLFTTNPNEVNFICNRVVPMLLEHYA